MSIRLKLPPDQRVLAVFDRVEPGAWIRQADVLAQAHLDTSLAIALLRALTQEGELEWSRLSRGRGHGSGRPAYLYRRRTRTEAA